MPLMRQVYPDAFGVERMRLRLKRGASDKLKGAFLPFTLAAHHCTIMFTVRSGAL
jgi:hypothetical protein